MDLKVINVWKFHEIMVRRLCTLDQNLAEHLLADNAVDISMIYVENRQNPLQISSRDPW